MPNDQQNINQQQQSNNLQQESIQQVQTLLESLKEVLGIRTKLTEFERETLNANKKLAELVIKQTTEYNSVAEKTKEIAKNDAASVIVGKIVLEEDQAIIAKSGANAALKIVLSLLETSLQ